MSSNRPTHPKAPPAMMDDHAKEAQEAVANTVALNAALCMSTMPQEALRKAESIVDAEGASHRETALIELLEGLATPETPKHVAAFIRQRLTTLSLSLAEVESWSADPSYREVTKGMREALRGLRILAHMFDPPSGIQCGGGQ